MIIYVHMAIYGYVGWLGDVSSYMKLPYRRWVADGSKAVGIIPTAQVDTRLNIKTAADLMYIYVYLYTYVYVYIYICIFINVYIYIYILKKTYIYIYIYI